MTTTRSTESGPWDILLNVWDFPWWSKTSYSSILREVSGEGSSSDSSRPLLSWSASVCLASPGPGVSAKVVAFTSADDACAGQEVPGCLLAILCEYSSFLGECQTGKKHRSGESRGVLALWPDYMGSANCSCTWCSPRKLADWLQYLFILRVSLFRPWIYFIEHISQHFDI